MLLERNTRRVPDHPGVRPPSTPEKDLLSTSVLPQSSHFSASWESPGEAMSGGRYENCSCSVYRHQERYRIDFRSLPIEGLGPGTLSKRLISFASLLRAGARGFWNIRSARTAPCGGQIARRAGQSRTYCV